MKSRISWFASFLVVSLLCLPVHAVVQISEFMASNSTTIADSFGEYSDWIELHNAGTQAVSLNGWRLTDDPTDLVKWRFPDVTIPADGYLLVFASDRDQRDPAGELHTNFKISASGETLTLVRPDLSIEDSIGPVALEADVSYGLDGSGSAVFFDSPTPGAAPGAGWQTVSPVEFSVPHGIYDSDFTLTLSTATEGARIYFTLDGSDPASSTTRFTYTEPIPIYNSEVVYTVRASATKFRYNAAPTVTQTYISLLEVLWYNGFDLPASWFAGASSNRTYDRRTRTADYAMDPDIVFSAEYGPKMRDALLSLPTVSLVMDVDDLFDPYNGIYPNSILRASDNDKWEKPASLELIDPTGTDDFSVNCGARIMGEVARWAAANDKQSFRIVFQTEYGPTKLKTDFFHSDDGVDKYDTIILRANFGDGWLADEIRGDETGVGFLNGSPTDNQYIRDQFAHDCYQAMGHEGVDGRFAHLYINGAYWGVYQVLERPDNNYHQQHIGGDASEWDVIKGNTWDAGQGRNGALQDGNSRTWDTLFSYFDVAPSTNPYSTTGQNIAGQFTPVTDAMLVEIEKYLDLDAYIDYMILLWDIDRGDFPKKNWYAACRRDGNGGGEPLWRFHFYTWDSEASLNSIDSEAGTGRWFDGSTGNDTGPVRMLRRLITNENFRLRFSQRAFEVFRGDGPLSGFANAQRYRARAQEVELALIAESARWGDWGGLHHDDPLTVEDDWRPEMERIVNEYFPARNAAVFEQMRAHGVYPEIDAPLILGAEGEFAGAVALEMCSSDSDVTIYYTLDGSDPRLPDGSVSPKAMVYTIDGLQGIEVEQNSDTWKYSDMGVDYGTAWTQVNFDDSVWKQGVCQFGYGDGDEDTPILFGNSASRNMTAYFRHTMFFEDILDVQSFAFDLLVDDGAVVYLNGQEILRFNMPGGEIGYSTPASSGISRADEYIYHAQTIDSSQLQDGFNVLAVEVHQEKIIDTDMSFDMILNLATNDMGVDTIYSGFNSIPIETDVHVKARAWRDGQWSVYREKFLYVQGTSPLVVSEVYYHPEDPSAAELAAGFDADDFEFIELHNSSDQPTSEEAARLDGGVTERLTPFTLAAGEYAVVVANEAAFRMRFGDDVRILGDYGERLSNAGEQVLLLDSFDTVLMDFMYLDDSGWPMAADGYGLSLNLTGDASQANLAESWEAAMPSPGAASGGWVGIEGDLDNSGAIDAADIDLLAAAIRAGNAPQSFDLDGSGAVDALDMDVLVLDILGTYYGDFDLNGEVDAMDFVVLKQHYNTPGSWAAGDANGDGQVDVADFVELKQNYGKGQNP